MALRWRLDPRPTGLSAVMAGYRGTTLYQDRILRCATVSESRDGGFYWVAGWECGIPKINTCDKPEKTEKKAKDAAFAYVKKHLEEMQ